MKIIAEIGQNHNGDMALAVELIHSAHENGADCAKFQIFDAPALFPKEGNEWYDYNCAAELSRDDVNRLAEICTDVGIEFMASVFDAERVAWLEGTGARQIKIASRSVNDRALIDAASQTGMSLLVSLGIWDEPEFPVIDAPGGVDYLYCISKYPTPFEDCQLATIDFARYAGFSDHSIGIAAPLAAAALGAGILEKHFTLDKDMYGPDHQGSMTPAELAQIAILSNEIERCL